MASNNFPTLPLYYSYNACGDLHLYSTGRPYWWTERPVYVFAFGTEIGQYGQAGTARWKAMANFVQQILLEMRVPAEVLSYRQLSASSAALYASEYSRCAHDVSLGHLDLCIGDFWDTPERRKKKVTFSNTVYSEAFYLYTRFVEEEKSLSERLTEPLRPFKLSLWLLICAVVVAAGFILLYFERSAPGGDFDGLNWAGFVKQCLFLSGSSLVDGTIVFSPKTPSGKLFSVVLAFFICVVIASFTGNTASFLLHQTPHSDVRDLDQALSLGYRICMQEAMAQQLLEVYPALHQHGVVTVSGWDNFPSMERGDCDATVQAEPLAMEIHSYGEFCQFHKVGRPIFAVPTAVVVSDRIKVMFDEALVTKRMDGSWSSLEPKIFPGSACARIEDSYSRKSKLYAEHMVGNCGLLLICFTTALVLKILRKAPARISTASSRAQEVISKSIRDLTGAEERSEVSLPEDVQESAIDLAKRCNSTTSTGSPTSDTLSKVPPERDMEREVQVPPVSRKASPREPGQLMLSPRRERDPENREIRGRPSPGVGILSCEG